MILPEELVPEIEALVLENYVSPAIFVEAALYEFVTGGGYEPNLERVRDGLRIRRDAMTRRPRAGARRELHLEQARGRLLPLARPAGRASAARLCSHARRRMTSPSSREPTSSSTAAGRKLRGSRTPSPPRRRSTRESAGSGASCATRPQSPPR